MRRSGWRLWGLAAAGLALSTTGCQRRGTETKAGAALSGEVQGVVSERRGDELRVSDAAGKSHTVRTDERTQVYVGGQPVQGLGEVHEGAEVRASFPAGDPKLPAVRIDVTEPAGAPEGAPPGAGGQNVTPSTPR